MSSPARIPGAAMRIDTSQNRLAGLRPREAASSSSAGSTPANAVLAAMMRNGPATNVCASTTPTIVPVSSSLKRLPSHVYGPTM